VAKAVEGILAEECGVICADRGSPEGFYGDVLVVEPSLPVSRGFGMSAAGSIAAAHELVRRAGWSERDTRWGALRIAHQAELVSGSGLGDVLAITAGGVAVRDRAGMPYSPNGGSARSITFTSTPRNPDGTLPAPILGAVVGGRLDTRPYIIERDWIERIKLEGRKALFRFVEAPSVSSLFTISRDFMGRIGLLDDNSPAYLPEVADAISAAEGVIRTKARGKEGPSGRNEAHVTSPLFGRSIVTCGIERVDLEKALGDAGLPVDVHDLSLAGSYSL